MNSSQLDSSDQDLASLSVQGDESSIAYEGFPYLSNFVELSNGLDMHYLDEGSGDPIILLHGTPTSSFLWRNIIPELSERGRVIVPDLINYGLSDKTEALTFVEQGELFSEFIDSLGLDDITFVLHDWGGPIGMTHVLDNPDDVKALAFLETFVLPFPDIDALGGRATPFIQDFIDPANNRQVVIEDNLYVEGILLNPEFGGIAEVPTEAEQAVYREPFLDPSSREQLLKTLGELPILDTTDHPLYDPDGPGGVPAEPVPNIQEFIDFSNFLGSEVDIPKLFIVGSPGRIVPPQFIPTLQEAIPGLAVQQVGSDEDPAFNFLQEDVPEDFTTALANWLDSNVLLEEPDFVFTGLGANLLDAVDPNDDFDGNLDIVFAGAGDDQVDASQASTGQNRILGGTGLDELFAGRHDRLFGGTGNDILDASIGSGRNRLAGGAGNDELFAGESDRLFGGDGDDSLDATTGSGDNRLYGQDGNDIFFAGSGDRLLGGDGDDAFFITDGGDNLLTGGIGADAFWIATGEFLSTANTITDFELGTDIIGIAGLGATSLADLELTQVGANTMLSFSGFDLAMLLNTQVSALQADGIFAFV